MIRKWSNNGEEVTVEWDGETADDADYMITIGNSQVNLTREEMEDVTRAFASALDDTAWRYGSTKKTG